MKNHKIQNAKVYEYFQKIRHNSLQNNRIKKIKKASETRAQELSSATKLVAVAQTI